MNASTAVGGQEVAVGLFGLLRNTSPAPLAAAAIASRSSCSDGVERDRAHGRADQLRVARALLVGELAGHQGPGGRGEELDAPRAGPGWSRSR